MVREQLQGHDFQDGKQEFVGLRDEDGVGFGVAAGGLDDLSDLFVSFDGDGDDAAGAGGDFLDVAEGLFVLEDGAGVVGVLGGDDDDGE